MHVHDVHVSKVSRPIKSIFRNLTFINLHFGVASPFNLKSLRDGNIRTSFDYPLLFFL